MNRTTLLSIYIYIYIIFLDWQNKKLSSIFTSYFIIKIYFSFNPTPNITKWEKKKSFFSFFYGTLKMATTFWGNLHRLCFHYACYCVYLWNNRKKWPVIASILGLSWNFRFRVASISGPFSLTLPLINKG